MSSKAGKVFPTFGHRAVEQKVAGFQRLFGGSEPASPAAVRAVIPILTVPVKAAIPPAIVVVPATMHAALDPAVPVLHTRQDGEAPLLAVIQRLVERIGRIG